jgi:hypothetical protein
MTPYTFMLSVTNPSSTTRPHLRSQLTYSLLSRVQVILDNNRHVDVVERYNKANEMNLTEISILG